MTDAVPLPHDWFPRPLPINVRVGPGTWIYSSYAFLHCQSKRTCAARIGAHSGIYLGTLFELGAGGQVEIGNYCAIVSALIRTDRRVVIEDYAFIAHEVLIADSPFAIPPDKAASADETGVAETSVIIRRNAWIGARAVLLGGADIGENAIVGAAAVVNGPVPSYAIAAGNPARVVGWARGND